MSEHQHQDVALRAANLAMSDRQQREAHRFASIELRHVDSEDGAWEAAAVAIVGLAAVLFVIGVWFV